LRDELTILLNWNKFNREQHSIRELPEEDERKLRHLKPILSLTHFKEGILLSPQIINLQSG